MQADEKLKVMQAVAWWAEGQEKRSALAWADYALAAATYDKTLTLFFGGAAVAILAIAGQSLSDGISLFVFLLLAGAATGVSGSVRLFWLVQERARIAFFVQLHYEVIVGILQPPELTVVPGG